MNIPLRKLRHDAITPTKAHQTDAGFDLYLPADHGSVSIGAGQRHTFRIGLSFAIPDGWMMKIEGRSGLAAKGIQVLGGIIDSSYRGEIGVIIRNSSEEHREFHAGDRIAQALILPVPLVSFEGVEYLDDSERGHGGFGSTGR